MQGHVSILGVYRTIGEMWNPRWREGHPEELSRGINDKPSGQVPRTAVDAVSRGAGCRQRRCLVYIRARDPIAARRKAVQEPRDSATSCQRFHGALLDPMCRNLSLCE